jgi:putative transposase
MPLTGGRKLHFLLTDVFEKHEISIGRDKLFDLLDEYGLLVRRRKRRRISTTDSNHPFRKYPNLVRELEVDGPNQLWVSDITYISLKDRFCYLSLITDAYSRKIIGYCLHPTLRKEGPLAALRMALDGIEEAPQARPIHHSDRGLQYCCAEYIAVLESKGMGISMTEKGDPYENAIAERVNGILKTEFMMDKDFASFEQALSAAKSAIDIYNSQRPHASCGYLTPEQAHLRQGPMKAKWKPKKKTDKKKEVTHVN